MKVYVCYTSDGESQNSVPLAVFDDKAKVLDWIFENKYIRSYKELEVE